MRISDWSSDVCSSDLMERINRDLNTASGFQPVAIKEDVSEAEYASVLVRLPDLPGIAPARGFARYYPTGAAVGHLRSEEHTSELQSLMRISYAVFCLKKKKET